MTYKLWLDDTRPIDQGLSTFNKDWKVARSSKEAIAILEKDGPPYFISFDYDLGEGDTAMAFLKWFAKRYSGGKLKLEPHFNYYVHARNGLALHNIYNFMEGLLETYPLEPLQTMRKHK
jgi:hypothetical protein